MNQTLRAAASIAGRAMLVAIFLMSAAGKIPNFEAVASTMKGEGVPMPELMLVGAITFLLAGGVSVLLGYQAQFGATLLLIFIALATFYFHDFWTVNPAAMWVNSMNAEVKIPIQGNEVISFSKNLAIAGALLMVIANGSGAGSLDNYLSAKEPETQGA